MIAFAPGELATIAGPLGDADGDGPSSLVTKSFNFNDLPCPPQSVMVNIRRQVCHVSSSCNRSRKKIGTNHSSVNHIALLLLYPVSLRS